MQARDCPAGLVTGRTPRAVLDLADPRWLDAAAQVIARHMSRSRPVRGLLLTEIEQYILDKLGLVNRTHIATRARDGLRTEQP